MPTGKLIFTFTTLVEVNIMYITYLKIVKLNLSSSAIHVFTYSILNEYNKITLKIVFV